VSAGDPRHGRRDNGLMASEYSAAGDVDPRVGEHLLDVLALQGIAAYLHPSTDMNPVTRSSSLPARPTDRLYVDRAHLAAARDYLRRLTEEGSPPSRPAEATEPAEPTRAGEGSKPSPPPGSTPASDVDDAWAEIVARFDTEPTGPRRSWPAAEDLNDDGSTGAGSRATPVRRPRAAPPAAESDEPSLLDGLDTFGADLPDDDEEGYTPPAPPPLPRPSMPAVLGVAGIIGGLVVFLRPDLLPMSNGTAMVLGFIACLAGVATLVWRLRPGDEEDDDPDDGARV
jgi:hypothetical protein